MIPCYWLLVRLSKLSLRSRESYFGNMNHPGRYYLVPFDADLQDYVLPSNFKLTTFCTFLLNLLEMWWHCDPDKKKFSPLISSVFSILCSICAIATSGKKEKDEGVGEKQDSDKEAKEAHIPLTEASVCILVVFCSHSC